MDIDKSLDVTPTISFVAQLENFNPWMEIDNYNSTPEFNLYNVLQVQPIHTYSSNTVNEEKLEIIPIPPSFIQDDNKQEIQRKNNTILGSVDDSIHTPKYNRNKNT